MTHAALTARLSHVSLLKHSREQHTYTHTCTQVTGHRTTGEHARIIMRAYVSARFLISNTALTQSVTSIRSDPCLPACRPSDVRPLITWSPLLTALRREKINIVRNVVVPSATVMICKQVSVVQMDSRDALPQPD